MPVVLSDRDAHKIKQELVRHRTNIVTQLADDAYREQWVGMLDRLIEKLEQATPPVLERDLDGNAKAALHRALRRSVKVV